MKLQYKSTGVMLILGILILILTTLVYSKLIKEAVLTDQLQYLENLSEEIAHHMNTHLESYEGITRSFASAHIIKDALLSSNENYNNLNENSRNNKIENLNKQWMETKDINNPFVRNHLTNTIAEFLKLQKKVMPDLYGEIFLTNKYGVMIASTEKLTTLAHAQKYWWKAGYYNGKGRVFFDDRGFDNSAEGYVLGIVVPIKENNEIIGIVKSNIKLESHLTDMIQTFSTHYPGKIQLIRTNGLIVAEKGIVPLSESLPEHILKQIQKKEVGSEFVTDNKDKKLLAFAPILLTMESTEYGFGGEYVSSDHIKGNEGEAWHIVLTLDADIALKSAYRTTKILLLSGFIFILAATLLALLMGKWFANPLIKLSVVARKIGEGDLEARINIITKDEVGDLARSVNTMSENLSRTLISRDNLLMEVEKRKAAEKAVTVQLKEKELILKETNHRIKNNFVSIAGLLNLQASSSTNTESISALKDAAGRVYSMAKLYEKMLLNNDYTSTSIKAYLNILIDDIIKLFPHYTNIKVKKKIVDFQLDPKSLVPIGIIVNELLTNIMKYAFIEKESGLIQVTLLRDNKNITLIVHDDGIGLPEGFVLEKQSGFGLSIIKMLTDQFHGSFTIENDTGTKSIIEFNI
jgi:two-component sensor histidine kinase/HAMP domain-containing protein